MRKILCSNTFGMSVCGSTVRDMATAPIAQLLLFDDDFQNVLADPGGAQEFGTYVTYLMTASKLTPDDLDLLTDRLGPHAKEITVTIAETLEARGRAEGEARGRLQGQAETLLTLLTQKFGQVSARAERTIREADADQLMAWITQVFAATTVDEALA